MPPEQLENFFASFRETLDRSNLPEVMLLLSGASRSLQELFGVGAIFEGG